ncbi:hypothetical protein GCK32_001750 [Trichostrongylus colubriformis]|uniref:Uncharacterized protein n=1 Tax=Trichostrongylus colubriformis TaxID=6319 RepID=A0AAN8EV40_TRICO
MLLTAVFSSVLACKPTNMVAMNEQTMAAEPMAKVFNELPENLFGSGLQNSPYLPTLPTAVYGKTQPPASNLYTTIPTIISTTEIMRFLSTSTSEILEPSTTRSDDDFTVKWTCSSAMVQIETTHPWDPDRIDIYRDLLNRNMLLLQHHSGRSLREFGQILRKVAKVESGNRQVFGELFFLPKIARSCDALREFVRKAVSWSKDIPRAVVACRCETAVEIYKVKPQHHAIFDVI